MTDNMSWDLEN